MHNKNRGKDKFTVGIISDTHGLLRPEAVDALQGSDLIIHAGDVGEFSMLDELNMTAPVVAVRGNMDNEGRAYELKKTEVIEKNKVLFYVIHDISRIDLDPSAAGFNAVISGHTHSPLIRKNGGVLYINPGSAGPRRSKLPVSVALLHVRGRSLDAEVIRLKV